MAYTPTFSPYMAPAMDPFMGETEEERRKRLEAESAAVPGPVAPSPVKQTITYDPVTGEQRMKIEGSVADLSAANPLTPTVQAPGEMGRGMPAPVAPAAPMAAPAPAAERQLPPGVQMVDGKLQLAPVGEGVQLAGPMVAGAIKNRPEPVVTAAQLGSQEFPMTRNSAMDSMAPPAPPAPAPAPAPATGFNPNTFQDQFMAAAGNKDIGGFSNLYQTTQDPVQKQIAGIALRDQMIKQVGLQNAPKELANMKNENDAARLLKSKTEEGSYAKMLLLGFISPDLAGKEATKLGLNDKWAVGQDAKGRALIYKTRDGVPVEGYDGTTGDRMSATDLITAVGSGQRKLDIVGGTYVNDLTGEVGRVVTDLKTGNSYIQTDTDHKPMAGFRPQASGGSLEQQNVTQQQQLMNKLHYEPAIAAASKGASTLAEYNALNGTNFAIAGRDSLGRPLLVDQRSNQMLQAPAAPAANAAPATNVVGTGKGPVVPQANAAPAVNVAGTGGRVSGGVSSGGGAVSPAVIGGTPAEREAAKKRIEAAEQEARALREAENKKRLAIEEAQGKQPIEVGTSEQKDFVTYKGVVQDKAEAGRDVARVTRGQVKDLMQDPVIIGIMNGSGTQYAAAGKLIREMAAGAYSDDDNGKRLADDIRKLSLSQPQQDALSRYAQANTSINRATLQANSGAGSISNAEQAANKAANMTNIGDLTPFAALTGLSRRQYQGDLSQEKAAMLAASKYVTRNQFDQAWQETEDKRVKRYDGIYRARLDLIKPFADKANANPNDAQAQQRYRDAAIHAFRVYPNPEYTAGVGWTYPTKESKRAAMAADAGDR